MERTGAATAWGGRSLHLKFFENPDHAGNNHRPGCHLFFRAFRFCPPRPVGGLNRSPGSTADGWTDNSFTSLGWLEFCRRRFWPRSVTFRDSLDCFGYASIIRSAFTGEEIGFASLIRSLLHLSGFPAFWCLRALHWPGCLCYVTLFLLRSSPFIGTGGEFLT